MPTDEAPATVSSPDTRVETLPSNLSSWLVTSVAALAAYLLVSRGLMTVGVTWQISLFVGAIAALAASSALQGAVIAGVVVAAGLVALPPAATATATTPSGIAAMLLGVGLALGVAYGLGTLRARQRRNGRRTVDLWIAVALVAWLLVCLWAPLFSAGFPSQGYGGLSASTLRTVPQPRGYVNDDTLYLRLYYLLHHGESYYQAFRDAWMGLATASAPPSSVTSVRLPTLYLIWRALPADPMSIAYLFLALVSAGVVAATFIGGQLAGSRFAPLAATALVAYAMGTAHTVYITYVDLPAISIALVGVALFVRARIASDLRYLWAAAAVITCAALMREILVYLILLAILTSLLEPAENRARRMAPWLASLGVFGMGYAAHTLAVRRMIVAQSSAITYLKGSPAFAADSFRRFTEVMTGNGFLMFLLFVLAIAAAIGSRKRAGVPFAAFASAALLAPVLTMLRVGNPGIDAAGIQVNYWGNLYLPLALALWPGWVLLLPGDKSSAK